jgi:acyl-CoA thioesterase-1
MLNGENERLAAAGPHGRARRGLLRAFFASFMLLVVSSLSAAAPPPHTIVLFGDSLTAGYGLADPGAESYPALLQQKIAAAGLDWRVVNAGLSGETTAAGVRRVDWILRQPVGLFVLALGANDGLRGIDPAVTQANLQAILDRVRAKYPAARIVVAGMQMPPSLGEDFTRRFQAIFPAVASKNDATLLPFLLERVGGEPELNQADRIHPNAAGHAIVAETVWKTLRPLLE